MLQLAWAHSHGHPGSVHEASAAAQCWTAQSVAARELACSLPTLYGEDVHEVKVQEGVVPPKQLRLWESNAQKLKGFCDTPGHSWNPYQAVVCGSGWACTY